MRKCAATGRRSEVEKVIILLIWSPTALPVLLLSATMPSAPLPGILHEKMSSSLINSTFVARLRSLNLTATLVCLLRLQILLVVIIFSALVLSSRDPQSGSAVALQLSVLAREINAIALVAVVAALG